MQLSRLFVSLCALGLASGLASAQTHLSRGDIATGANGVVGILDRDGASSNYLTSSTSISTLLWDPSRPDEFIGGGGNTTFSNTGLLVRQVFTASNQMTTTSLAPSGSFGVPVQLSWDKTGQKVIVVSIYDQVHSVDAATGAVTDLTTGAQPWGTNVTCGAMDPITGDIFVGNASGEIWRLASGGGSVTMFQSGLGSLKRILFESSSSPSYLYFASADRFGRVNLAGPPSAKYYFGVLGTPSLSGIVTAAVDEVGDFVLGTSNDSVYRLPRVSSLPLAGVAPVLLGRYAFPNTTFQSLRDLAVIGASTEPFRLLVDAVPVLGASVALENVPGPLGFGWILFSANTFLPVDSGPLFGLVPDSLTLWVMNMRPKPGAPLAFIPPAPPGFNIKPLGMLPFAGQTWDAVAVAFSPTGVFLGRTNVERTTWQ